MAENKERVPENIEIEPVLDRDMPDEENDVEIAPVLAVEHPEAVETPVAMAAPPIAEGPPSDEDAVRKAPPSQTADVVMVVEQITLLRNVRAEVQDLKAMMGAVRKGEVDLDSQRTYITKTFKDIKALMDQFVALEAKVLSSDLDARKRLPDDTVRHLHNLWEQMQSNPILDDEQQLETQAQLQHLDSLDAQIKRLTYYIGYLTIPSRVNDWLRVNRPNYYIPFHVVFEDEVPDEADRAKILQHMALAPETLRNGLVDLGSGVIYRYHESVIQQEASVAWLGAALFILTSLIALLASANIAGSIFQPANTGLLLMGWVAILAGIVTHVGVDSVKRQKERGGLPPLVAMGDVVRLVDARLGQFLRKLLLAAVGYFAYAFSVGTTVASFTLLGAFLVGYSLDSFVELFGASIEQQSSTQLAAMKKQLGLGKE